MICGVYLGEVLRKPYFHGKDKSQTNGMNLENV
jgi:hypothetical protein